MTIDELTKTLLGDMVPDIPPVAPTPPPDGPALKSVDWRA
jgi:hypothetical protein